MGAQLRAALDAMDTGMAAALGDLGVVDYRPRFSGIVRVLAHAGPCGITDLAVATGVTQSAASQTVNELRRRGLVSLERGADERRRIVSLTQSARDLLPAVEAEWAATGAAMASLDAELSTSLRTIAAELTAALERRPFRQRIRDAAGAVTGTDAGAHRAALACGPAPSDPPLEST